MTFDVVAMDFIKPIPMWNASYKGKSLQNPRLSRSTLGSMAEIKGKCGSF